MIDLAEQYGELLGERVRPYAVAPVADGGVFIEWRGIGGRLQVRVDGQGKPTFLMQTIVDSHRTLEERSDVSWPDILLAAASVLLPELRVRG